MQKIEIEFKEQTLKCFLIIKEKNLDKTLLNTNIISNEKLLFSLDYIKNNQKIVSGFLKELCLDKKTNVIQCNDMHVIETVANCFKNIPIEKIIMLTNENFTYNAYDTIKKMNYLKEIECVSIPTYLIELFDRANIKVISKQEVLFSSQFMANNDLTNYSAIFYAKNIKLACPIVSTDYEDLKTFFKINKYLKTIELYHYLAMDLMTLLGLLKDLRIKNITISIHDNITDKDQILQLKELKKESHKKHITINLAYSKEYIQNNYIKQLIATTIKSCCVIILILCILAFGFVMYNNKQSENNVKEIHDTINSYLDSKDLENLIPDEKDPINEDDPQEQENPETPPVENDPNPLPEKEEKNPVILALKELNSDTVGWLTVPGTNIDYPVVKTTDNAYYLKHNFNKKTDYNGWVFMNAYNSTASLDQNTIIFAHNRYYSKIMFGTLNKVGKKAWYQNAKENLIVYNDVYQEMKWEVFSAYTIPVTDDYLKTNFRTDEEWADFIKMIRKRSVFKSDVVVYNDDKILTLSTCADINTRFVVHAVLKNAD